MVALSGKPILKPRQLSDCVAKFEVQPTALGSNAFLVQFQLLPSKVRPPSAIMSGSCNSVSSKMTLIHDCTHLVHIQPVSFALIALYAEEN